MTKNFRTKIIPIGLVCCAIALCCVSSIAADADFHKSLSEHQHYGNHYAYKAPTQNECGHREYWICCSCHQVYLSMPEDGTFIDRDDSEATGSKININHKAFIPALKEKQTHIDFENNGDNTYTATITSNYDATIIMPNFLDSWYNPGTNWDNAYFVYDPNISFASVKNLVLGEGCTIIQELKSFKYLDSLVLSENVKELLDRSLPPVNNLIINSDLPKHNVLGLYTEGRTYLYVQEEIGKNLGVYYCGNRVRFIGTTYPEEQITTNTTEEYSLKAANQALAISDYLYKSCKSDFERQMLLYPYSPYDDYCEIRNFTLDLIKDCKNEEEKCLTIYTWVGTNINYSYENGSVSIYQALCLKTGVCSQFAALMHDMLCAAGIYSFYVHGQKGSFSNWTTYNLINYDISNSSNNHAWLTVMVDGAWKFYDPTTTYKELNMNLYAMSSETLVGYNRVCSHVDDIKCLPEDLSYVNLKNSQLLLRDGLLRSFTNNGYSNSYFNGTYYNAGFHIARNSYIAHTNTDFYNFSDMKNDLNIGDIICNKFYYAHYTVITPSNFNFDSFQFSLSGGRSIDPLDGLKYTLLYYSVEFVNALLNDSIFQITDSGFYLKYEGNLHLLKSF